MLQIDTKEKARFAQPQLIFLFALFFAKEPTKSAVTAPCVRSNASCPEMTPNLAQERLSRAHYLADGFAEPDFLISGNQGLWTPGSNINFHNLQQKHKPLATH